jgi:hypothetical protein
MPTPSDRFHRAIRRVVHPGRPAAALAAALSLGALALATARPSLAATDPDAARASHRAAPPAGAVLSDSDRRELRQTLEAQYQVTGVHNGVLLKPRVEKLGVREIEVSGDAVQINGVHANADVLRPWLRADAEPLLRLLALPPAERQALFDLKRDVAPPPPPGAPPSQVAPDRRSASGASAGPATPPGTGEDDEDDRGGDRAARRGRLAPPEAPIPPTSPTPPEPPEPSESPETSDTEIPPIPPVPPVPPIPEMPVVSSGSRIRFAGPVTVERGEVAEEAMAFAGSVHIEGEVNHNVMAVGGSVRVNGRVGGNVTAYGGSVHLGPHSEVMGDVAAVGGTVVRERGAIVHGSLSDVGHVMPDFLPGRHDPWDDDSFVLMPPLGRSLHLLWSLALLVLVVLAVSLVALLAPRALETVRRQIAGEPWITLAAGLLGQVLAIPLGVAVVVLFAITIVGCLVLPLVIPLLAVALAVAALVGFAGVSNQVGRLLEDRFNRRPGSAYFATVVGVLAIESFSLLSGVLSLGGGIVRPFALLIWAVGWLVRFAAWTMGFGAAILCAFENRPQRFRRKPPAAPAGSSATAAGGAPGYSSGGLP